MSRTIWMDNRPLGSWVLTRRTQVKLGMRVRVFNAGGEDWFGHIRAINKTTCRVECEDKIPPFDLRDARPPHNDGRHFLIHFSDLSKPWDDQSESKRAQLPPTPPHDKP